MSSEEDPRVLQVLKCAAFHKCRYLRDGKNPDHTPAFLNGWEALANRLHYGSREVLSDPCLRVALGGILHCCPGPCLDVDPARDVDQPMPIRLPHLMIRIIFSLWLIPRHGRIRREAPPNLHQITLLSPRVTHRLSRIQSGRVETGPAPDEDLS